MRSGHYTGCLAAPAAPLLGMRPVPPPKPADTQDAPAGVLEYRSPSTGSHRVQRVMRALERDETFGAASVGLKLLVGIPLCLLAPLVVTVVLKSIEREFRADVLPGFEMTFLAATALLSHCSCGSNGGRVASSSLKGCATAWWQTFAPSPPPATGNGSFARPR